MEKAIAECIKILLKEYGIETKDGYYLASEFEFQVLSDFNDIQFQIVPETLGDDEIIYHGKFKEMSKEKQLVLLEELVKAIK